MVPQQDSLQGTREATGNGEGEPVYGGGEGRTRWRDSAARPAPTGSFFP